MNISKSRCMCLQNVVLCILITSLRRFHCPRGRWAIEGGLNLRRNCEWAKLRHSKGWRTIQSSDEDWIQDGEIRWIQDGLIQQCVVRIHWHGVRVHYYYCYSFRFVLHAHWHCWLHYCAPAQQPCFPFSLLPFWLLPPPFHRDLPFSSYFYCCHLQKSRPQWKKLAIHIMPPKQNQKTLERKGY